MTLAVVTRAESPLARAWVDASNLLVNEAHHAFATERPVSREGRLGQAITLLNVQPRTDGNVGEAAKLLDALVQENGRDEIGVFARYFRARIYQSFVVPAQLGEARKLYRQLLAECTGDPLPENAAAQLVIMDLYENIAPADRDRRCSALESLGGALKTASGRRDFHLALGNAYLDFELSPQKALEHLLAADSEGITHSQVEASTWVGIEELARRLERSDLAAAYCEKFLKRYPRDNRCDTIRRRLSELQASSSRPAP